MEWLNHVSKRGLVCAKVVANCPFCDDAILLYWPWFLAFYMHDTIMWWKFWPFHWPSPVTGGLLGNINLSLHSDIYEILHLHLKIGCSFCLRYCRFVAVRSCPFWPGKYARYVCKHGSLIGDETWNQPQITRSTQAKYPDCYTVLFWWLQDWQCTVCAHAFVLVADFVNGQSEYTLGDAPLALNSA